MTFSEKLNKAKNGSKAAYESLCLDAADNLYATALIALKGETAAKESVAAAIRDGYSGISRIKDEKHLRSWLVHELTKNIVDTLKEYKATGVSRTLTGIFAVTSGLPDVERLVFAISASFGYGKHEISLLTGMPEDTVGDKLESARNRLGADYEPLAAAAAAYRAPEELKERYTGFDADEEETPEEEPEPEEETLKEEPAAEEPEPEEETPAEEPAAEESELEEETTVEEPAAEEPEPEEEETPEEPAPAETNDSENSEGYKVFADESAAEEAVPDEESEMDEFPENGDEKDSPLPLDAKTFIAVVTAEKLKGSEFLRLIGNTRISNSAYREIEKNPHLTKERLITLLEESPLTEGDYYKMLTAVKQRRELLKEKEKIEAAHERAGLFSGTPRERPARRRLREEQKPQKSELQLAIEKEMHSGSAAPAPAKAPEAPAEKAEAYSPLAQIPDKAPAAPETHKTHFPEKTETPAAPETHKTYIPEKTETPAAPEPRRHHSKEERRGRSAASGGPESLSDVIGAQGGLPHKRGEYDMFRSAEIALKVNTDNAGEAVNPFAAIYARETGYQDTPAKPVSRSSERPEPDDATAPAAAETNNVSVTQQLEMPFPKLGSSDMQEHPFAVMRPERPEKTAGTDTPELPKGPEKTSAPDIPEMSGKKSDPLSVTQILDDFSYNGERPGYDMSVTQILEGLDKKTDGLGENASSTYGIKAPVWSETVKDRSEPETQLFASPETEESTEAVPEEQPEAEPYLRAPETNDEPAAEPLTLKEPTGPIYIPDFEDTYLHVDDIDDDDDETESIEDIDEEDDAEETGDIPTPDVHYADEETDDNAAFEVHYADEEESGTDAFEVNYPDDNETDAPEPEEDTADETAEDVPPSEVNYADEGEPESTAFEVNYADEDEETGEADTPENEPLDEETDDTPAFEVHFADEEPVPAEEEAAPEKEKPADEEPAEEPEPAGRKAPIRFIPGEMHDTVQFEVSGSETEKEEPPEPAAQETEEPPFVPEAPVQQVIPDEPEAAPVPDDEPEQPRKRYMGNEHFIDDDEYVEGINNGKMIFCAVCAVLLIGGACAMKFLPKQNKPAAEPAVPVSASVQADPQATEPAAPVITVPTESKDILAAFASYDEITTAGENVPAAVYDIQYMNASARPYAPTLTKRYLQTATVAYIYNEGTIRMVSLDPAAPVELGTVKLQEREGSEFIGFTVLDGMIYAVSQTGTGTASAKVWTDIFDGGFAVAPYSLDGTFVDMSIVAGKPVIITHAQTNGTSAPQSSAAETPAPTDIVRLAGSEFAGFTVIGEIGGEGLLDIYGGNASFVNSDGGLTVLAVDNNRTYAVDITADLKAENARVFAGEAFSGDCLNGGAFIGADRNGGVIAAKGANALTTGVEGEKPTALAWADKGTAYVLAGQNNDSVMLYGFDMSGEEPASAPAPISAFYSEKLAAAGSGLAGLAAECDASGDRTGLKLSLYSYSGALKETASAVIGLDEKTDAENLRYLTSDAETDPAFISVSENGDIIAVPTVYFDGFSEVVRIVTFSGSSLKQTGELMLYETKSPYVCTAIRQGTLFVMTDGKVMTANAADCSNVQSVDALTASMGENAGWLE